MTSSSSSNTNCFHLHNSVNVAFNPQTSTVFSLFFQTKLNSAFMTYVSVSDCRPNYLSVTNCSAVLETANYMQFSQLLVAVPNAYCCLSHAENCVIPWIIYFKVWLKLPSGPSVCIALILRFFGSQYCWEGSGTHPMSNRLGAFCTVYFLSYKDEFIEGFCHTEWYTVGRSLGKLPGGHFK
jgi:hypothetical protein